MMRSFSTFGAALASPGLGTTTPFMAQHHNTPGMNHAHHRDRRDSSL